MRCSLIQSTDCLKNGLLLLCEFSEKKSEHSLQASESLFRDTQLPPTLPHCKAQLQSVLGHCNLKSPK